MATRPKVTRDLDPERAPAPEQVPGKTKRLQVEVVEIDQEVVVVIAQEEAQEAEDEENLSKYKGRKEAGKAYLCRTFFKKS